MPESSASSALQALDKNQILTTFHFRNFGQVETQKMNHKSQPQKKILMLRLPEQGSESQAASGLQQLRKSSCHHVS